jgi:uncharacterized delta-60 repeat protein
MPSYSRAWIVGLLPIIALVLFSCDPDPEVTRSEPRPGSVDGTFDPGSGGYGGLSGGVISLAVQADDKVVVGGDFSAYDGYARNNIVRLGTNGYVDLSFDPGQGTDAPVSTVLISQGGKVLIEGGFEAYNGTARAGICRVNGDGSLDTSFDPGTGIGSEWEYRWISAMAVQSDGKILLAGQFHSYDGVAVRNVARLNVDGSLDGTFDPGSGPRGSLANTAEEVADIALLPDGKIIIVGSFDTVDGISRNGIARLLADGTLDTAFDPGAGADGLVRSVAIQDDGRVVIGGQFETVNGRATSGIARLNSDGSVDTDFVVGSGTESSGLMFPPGVYCLLIDQSGRAVVGGCFSTVDGVPRRCLTRLNTDGSLDSTFDPGSGTTGADFGQDIVNCLGIDSEGNIFVGGYFEQYDNQDRRGIARVVG